MFVWEQPVLHTEMWSDRHQSVWSDMKKQNKQRQTTYLIFLVTQNCIGL